MQHQQRRAALYFTPAAVPCQTGRPEKSLIATAASRQLAVPALQDRFRQPRWRQLVPLSRQRLDRAAITSQPPQPHKTHQRIGARLIQPQHGHLMRHAPALRANTGRWRHHVGPLKLQVRAWRPHTAQRHRIRHVEVVVWLTTSARTHGEGVQQLRTGLRKGRYHVRVVEIKHGQSRDAATDQPDSSCKPLAEPVLQRLRAGATSLQRPPGRGRRLGILRVSGAAHRQHGPTPRSVAPGGLV